MPDNENSNTTPAESKLVKRADLKSYMDVAEAGAPNPSYALIGEGFTSLSESKNPKEYSRQYIHEYTERTDVVGYAPALAYNVDVHTNNAVIAKIVKVTDEELTGSDAKVSIVTVNCYEGTETARPAFKRDYNIIPDGKADGVEALVYTGNLKAGGDIVKGTFNETTKVFTATDDSTLSTITVASAAGTASGDTAITLTGYTPGSGESYVYKIAETTAPTISWHDVPDFSWTPWNGSADITATDGYKIAIVSVDADGKAVAYGSATVTNNH